MATPPPPGPRQPYAAPGPYNAPDPYRHAPGPYAGPPPYAQAPALACEMCGGGPAAPVTVRGHQGMVVLMRFLKRQGVFCRDCGLATFRQMSGDTLWQGWWSPLSLIFTPITLLMNLGARARVRRLPAPSGGWRPSLDPGKPLLLRLPALLALTPIALIVCAVPVLMLIGVLGDFKDSEDEPETGTLSAGDCAVNLVEWPEQRLREIDCGSGDAQGAVYKVKASPCGPGDFLTELGYSTDGTTSFCLERRR
ncbi:hypothetical protein P8605_19045 [Streptomyces sp. T-3]|nr:hypothetical protein [Streptomyces sp. T-3]